ncbi:MAG: hypothetical protein LIO94_02190, partial [Clostridiales bacterium]|nr:hypothetical protein [Clostridiales bacterium]
ASTIGMTITPSRIAIKYSACANAYSGCGIFQPYCNGQEVKKLAGAVITTPALFYAQSRARCIAAKAHESKT